MLKLDIGVSRRVRHRKDRSGGAQAPLSGSTSSPAGTWNNSDTHDINRKSWPTWCNNGWDDYDGRQADETRRLRLDIFHRHRLHIMVLQRLSTTMGFRSLQLYPLSVPMTPWEDLEADEVLADIMEGESSSATTTLC